MRQFHHVGIPGDEPHPGEVYLPENKIWRTEPTDHPYKVEYLRFAPDSPVTGPPRELPHFAFETDDLEGEIAGKQILLEPHRPMEGLTVAWICEDGAPFEFMQWDEGCKPLTAKEE